MLLLYFVFVHFVLLVPGYTLIHSVKLLRDKPSIELCMAYVVSILSLGGLAIAGYVLDIPRYWLHSLCWIAIAFGTYFFVKQRLYINLKAHLFPLLALGATSLFSLAFISLQLTGPWAQIPDPQYQEGSNYRAFNVKVLNVAQTVANDNYIPYRQAQFMVNRSDPAKDSFIDEWGVHFFQRTPLMGAATAQFFTLLGDTPPIAYTWSAAGQDPERTYEKFQVIAHIMNALLVLPAFFLLTRLFNRRTAQAALLFIIPSHFFLYNAFFSWPKSLVAFFILLSWLLLFEKRLRYVAIAGIVSGLAYMAHDLAVLYIGASALLLLYWRRFRDLLIFGAIHLIFALPWLIVSSVIYKKPSTFILYPLSLHDIPQAAQKREIIQEFLHTSPLRLLAIRLESLYYLLTPYQFIHSEGGQAISTRLWAGSIYNIPGAAGIGLIMPILYGTLKQIRNLPFWILAVVPVILCTVVIGWPKGLGALHFAEASVVLFIGLGIWAILTLKNKWLLLAAYGVNCAQLVFFGLQSYNFRAGVWLTSPRDLVLLAVMIVVIICCGLGVYFVSINKSPAWRRVVSRLSFPKTTKT